MTILVLGINHKTASVALREKVAFSDEKRAFALRHIRQIELAESAVILSTCNRTEVYLHNKTVPPQETQHWIRQAIQWFAEIHQLDLTELQRCLYTYENLPAVNHLMEVACGLDSLILGEPQILGQVKQAYQMSEQHYQQEQQAISGELSRLFQKTFSTAKRVRTETNIGESAVSVAYAACSLARQIFESLSELTILLVGAGETIELVCRHLLRHGVKNMVISNRTLARAEALVEKLDTTANIQILPLEQLQQGLNQADIVISSTGSPNVLITKAMAEIAEECKQEAYDLFLAAAEQEKDWADYLFKDGSMIGLNRDILVQYVEYITNIRMQAVGLPLPFQARSNPIPWINAWLVSDNVQVAPQEVEVSSYLVGQIDSKVDTKDFDDFDL